MSFETSLTSFDKNMKQPFFRRVDWASFWTATLLSFIVYFITTAPSVTLEDSGELAVAGDYLGVPHPPGYPIWTICAWIFARLLSFVTFRGQPNPAWAIAVLSGFFGAIATGMTAMLITRTSSDMLRDMEGDINPSPAPEGEDAAHSHQRGITAAAAAPAAHDNAISMRNALCWTGGVAGSLVFAFSPVMWSQSTIVEVYTLNAMFLMWIFLLTYRWMRQPANRTLWLTAFVFGLGLTNYQVLLLAIVPLLIVIFLKEMALFRDVLLVGIPFVLTMGIMKLGALSARPGFNKHEALPKYKDMIGPPLIRPELYVAIAAVVLVFVGACVALGLIERKHRQNPKEARVDATVPWVLCAASGLALLILLLSLPAAPARAFPPSEPAFSWSLPVLVFIMGIGALWLFAAWTPGGRSYAAAITAIELALAGLLVNGSLLGLTHPQTWWFWLYLILNFVVLALAWILLPNGRTVALTILAVEAGASFYAYMPISSDRNPPMNWGYARTWEGFKHAISRGQYEKILPTDPFTPEFIRQLGIYFADLRMQFTLLLAPLGFIPFAIWEFRVGKRPVRAFRWALLLAIAVATLAALNKVVGAAELRLDKLLFALILLAAMVGGLTLVINQVTGIIKRALNSRQSISERITALTCLGLGLTVVVLVGLGFANAGAEYILESGGLIPPIGSDTPFTHAHQTAVFLTTAVVAALVAGAVYILTLASRKRLASYRMPLDDTAQQWLIATLAGFLMMSLFLIMLANTKGDLQDSFIQKVKFVSSHGLFAVWIGYGIAFGLATLQSHAKRHDMEWVLAPAMLAALATALIPIRENYFNDELVSVMSAANQDGHDFGWQFGNYQLRGAAAINEELDPDEEPLPNPDYPPAMTENAVFFGGTDPGRFVPTYMIYSAKVRPDVFLITQNALADNTYMNTMRDLYGDHIWMPMPRDNGAAFQQYVDEVEAGKRPNYGDISYEGGRVQVTGALAVMEINGILTERIFKKNRALHDFYLEESYPIRWMYPYLSPHGLILKINHDATSLDSVAMAADMDFWDWYARRLLGNKRFRRDVVARKSFSKLRGAIAGLYSSRALSAQAERAFREARAMYPVSPEANLRLVQEILIPQRRFEEGIELIRDLQAKDPNNARLPEILGYVTRAHATDQHVNALLAKHRSGTLSTDETIELAEAYATGGRPDAGLVFVEPLATRDNLDAAQLYRLARVFSRASRIDKASEIVTRISEADLNSGKLPASALVDLAGIQASARKYDSAALMLTRHLRQWPDDIEAWLDLATISMQLNRMPQAMSAIQQAAQRDPQKTTVLIQRSPDLQRLVNQMARPPQRAAPLGPRLPSRGQTQPQPRP